MGLEKVSGFRVRNTENQAIFFLIFALFPCFLICFELKLLEKNAYLSRQVSDK